MTSTAFKQIGNLNSAIGALMDNIIETVKTDVTTALRQEYQQKLTETTNRLNAEITTALRQEYQQKLNKTTHLLQAKITTAIRQEYQQKLTETTNQLSAKITTAIRQEYQKKLTETTNQLSAEIVDLQTKYEQLKEPKWPLGSYCILANGACPAGFNQISGYIRAIKQYATTSPYLNQATFGSSVISCHGTCGVHPTYSDLRLVTCCK